MNLLCPFCQKSIAVFDSEAGKTVSCPECGEQFNAPHLPYTPSFAQKPQQPWAPTPPAVPETYVSTPAPGIPVPVQEARADRDLSDYRKVVTLPFRPDIIRWIPPAALTIVFLLTFFSWDGMYPAGFSAYTQSAWQCLFGSVSYDPVAEDQLKLVSDLQERVKSNLWLFPYLLFLFPALALAWAGPVVEVAKIKLPPNIEPYWKYRAAILGAILIVMFLFLLAQCASGFGIQQAIDRKVEEKYAPEKADANTPEKEQRWQMTVDGVKGYYRAKTTPWLRLAILFHLIGTLAAAGEAGLALRGQKPPPRLAAMW